MQDKVAVPCANGGVDSKLGEMSHVTEVHGLEVEINVRAGNAVQQQAFLFLAVSRQRRWANSGPASDSRDSSGAQAERGRPDGLGVYRHRPCNRYYFSRAGVFLRSV